MIRQNKWVLTASEKPREGENIEFSENGIACDGTMNYKRERECMLAGIAGGNGYFGSLGFATDGNNGTDFNLICDEPKYWRYHE